MKIAFTGGATGGHFYPIIAVVEEIHDIVRERGLVEPELYFLSTTPYDQELLYENEIEYVYIPAGKMRMYFSLKNIGDTLKTLFGIPNAMRTLFSLHPDVVFSKGGYASVPTVFAARLLRFPLFIHDSDAVPGRANLWAGKFADRIAVSYQEAASHFKRKEVVANTGQPVRRDIQKKAREGAHEFLKLDASVPTLFILGGSQGAQAINDAIVEALPELLNSYQVIHQTGAANYEALKTITDVELEGHAFRSRYKPFPYLNTLAMRMAAGAANLVISRAGSTIFEIALWETPAILIPIPEEVSRDQRLNAFAYARTGGATVIEQNNLTPHILLAEVGRILGEEAVASAMREAARTFKRPEAARVIAEELIHMALEHES